MTDDEKPSIRPHVIAIGGLLWLFAAWIWPFVGIAGIVALAPLCIALLISPRHRRETFRKIGVERTFFGLLVLFVITAFGTCVTSRALDGEAEKRLALRRAPVSLPPPGIEGSANESPGAGTDAPLTAVDAQRSRVSDVASKSAAQVPAWPILADAERLKCTDGIFGGASCECSPKAEFYWFTVAPKDIDDEFKRKEFQGRVSEEKTQLKRMTFEAELEASLGEYDFKAARFPATIEWPIDSCGRDEDGSEVRTKLTPKRLKTVTERLSQAPRIGLGGTIEKGYQYDSKYLASFSEKVQVRFPESEARRLRDESGGKLGGRIVFRIIDVQRIDGALGTVDAALIIDVLGLRLFEGKTGRVLFER